MSRQVPMDEPLSDENRAYLESRGQEATIRMIDGRHAESDEDEDALGPDGDAELPADYSNWTGAELEAELRKRRLPYSGNNQERAERLRAHDAQQQP